MKLDRIQYFDVILKYLSKFPIGKDIDEKLDFVCDCIYKDIENTIDNIKGSIYFFSFYYFTSYLSNKKGMNKKENIKSDINEFMSNINSWILIDKKEVAPALKEVLFSDRMVEELEAAVGTRGLELFVGKEEIFEKDFSKLLRESLVQTIISVCHLLEEIGVMGELLNNSNKKFYKINLGFMNISLGEIEEERLDLFEKNKEEIPKTLRSNYSRKWLEKQNLQNLIAIASFWINKLSKVFESIVQILLILSENLTILVGITRGEITKEVVSYWYYENLKDKKKYINIIKEMSRGESKLYSCINKLNLAVDICYIAKSLSIYGFLDLSIEKSYIKNYGVCLSTFKENMVVIAFDVPGYNLPITFHISIDKLSFFLSNFKHTDKIKVYLGEDDFVYNKTQHIGTAILYSVTSEQKENIKKLKDKNNLFAHLDFIQRGIWPSYMRDAKGKPKKEYISISELQNYKLL